jgi:endonuclease/exonuclease/phosphatase family metal-dependent hydrolase
MKRNDARLAFAFGLLLAALILMISGKAFVVMRPQIAPIAGDELRVLSWNLGYGGLGAESDFVADGGKMFFPPSGAAVQKNIDGIVKTLRDTDADLYIFPEAAKPSPLTLWHDVLGALSKAFPDAERVFSADIFTRFLPWPVQFEHGIAIYSRKHIGGAEVAPLPREEAKIAGFIARDYSARILHLPVKTGADWIVIGVHFAAFDKDGAARKKQLAALIALAQQLHAAGNPVVIAGDFNLRLAPTEFPSTTSAQDRAWVHDFPADALPQGWRIGADPVTPTVRTNERPYKAGENYTTVVDGFIVSPDVDIISVKTRDVGFRFSDHQPVEIVVRRR